MNVSPVLIRLSSKLSYFSNDSLSATVVLIIMEIDFSSSEAEVIQMKKRTITSIMGEKRILVTCK